MVEGGCYYTSNRNLVPNHIEYECSPVYGTLSSCACIGGTGDWLGYVWGDGQYLCGKETMECGGGSAALTKTSLFLPLTPDARISSVLSRAWNVQELSGGRDVAEDGEQAVK